MADPVIEDGSPRVLWRWEDGWTLVRLYSREHLLRLPQADSARPSHGLVVLLNSHGERECDVVVDTFVQVDGPSRFYVFSLPEIGYHISWEAIFHFVSLVRDVVRLLPTSAGLPSQFAGLLLHSWVWDGEERTDVRSIRTSLSFVDPELEYASQEQVFGVFSPFDRPGCCADTETEVEFLLGNMPLPFLR